ncbi:hypothetical protein M9H77_03789 [Catharanthus roseus]|uniref:Uncharacterized protein n=1 Tax=Catharanthus roseus TaxID=4058 RepID=A0ACC0CCB8_CATRO|nr:hypothetical protein M9H77_03789 [Catharanthus roseus]
MGERLLWNRALLWCLAGIDYEMSEFGSDDLAMGFGLCLWSPIVALHVLFNLGVEAALMCLDLLRLPSCARNPHVGSSISVVKMAHLSHKWIYQEGTLVGGPSKTTSSKSYSLREIVPKRKPILVIDLSDSESVEGPVALEIRLGASIEENPSEPESDAEMVSSQREWHWWTLRAYAPLRMVVLRWQHHLPLFHLWSLYPPFQYCRHYFGAESGSTISMVIACSDLSIRSASRASGNDVDGFLTLRVDPLEEGRSTWRAWPNWYLHGNCIMLNGGMAALGRARRGLKLRLISGQSW